MVFYQISNTMGQWLVKYLISQLRLQSLILKKKTTKFNILQLNKNKQLKSIWLGDG